MTSRFHAILLAASLMMSAAAQAKDRSVSIERFAVPGHGSVNTYIVDAPDGLIVIDFQRDTKSAAEAIEKVRARGKPVVALLVTHAHPDHIGGLDQFKRAFPNAPIYASKETAAEIASDSLGFQKLTREALGPLAPLRYPPADRIIASRVPLSLARLRIEPIEMGPGESISTTVFYVPSARALFATDVVIDGMTDFLMEGRTGPWLRQIKALEQGFPAAEQLYPGHGAEGPMSKLVAGQKEYLEAVRSAVAARAKDGRISREAQTDILAELEKRFGTRPPVAEIPEMDRLNLDAVAKELAAEPNS